MKTLLTIFAFLTIGLTLFSQELSKSSGSVVSFSTQEPTGEGTNGFASLIYDGNINTYWHSQWTAVNPPLPHSVVIDLGGSAIITGFKLWPRHNAPGGRVTGYSLDGSNDGTTWTSNVASGTITWASNGDTTPKTVSFAAVGYRFVRFKSTAIGYSSGVTAIGEITFLGAFGKQSSAKALSASTDVVYPNSVDNIVLPLLLDTYDTSAIILNSITFSTAGTTQLSEVAEVKVYYSSTNNFASAKLFASSTSVSASMTLSGSSTMANGSNYVWITYSLKPTALSGNLVAAQLSGVSISGEQISPLAPNPVSSRSISSLQLTHCPVNKQLYPRDRTTNFAQVRFAGKVIDGNQSIQQIKTEVFRGGVLTTSITKDVVYTNHEFAFDYAYSQPAELQNYSYKTYLVKSGSQELVHSVDDILSGDVYIITGQSNAVSIIWWGENTNELNTPFNRTFGSGASSGDYPKQWFNSVSVDPAWSNANGAACPGQVGMQGMYLGKKLIDKYNVPVAIFNGGHGGEQISFFARNDANPTDMATNYGRLLTRLKEANLTDYPTALIWYQGETDGGNGTAGSTYLSRMNKLYSDWKKDFPALKDFFVYQIKQGCGNNLEKANVIQEAHRLFAKQHNEVHLLTTQAVAQQEGCHFPKAGHNTMTTQLMRQINYYLFQSAADTVGMTPPDIAYIEMTKPNEITINTTSDTPLTWDAGAHSDFKLYNTTNTIVGGSVSGNAIKLTTSLPFTSATDLKISYYGRGSVATPSIKNSAGLSIVCFNQLPVVSTAIASRDVEVAVADTLQGGAFIFGVSPSANRKIRVACIGNSITFGHGITNRESNSYPAQLQKMLGNGFEVINYGVSGTTLLKKGDSPYRNQGAYTNAKNFNPDIVIIKLGTNDTKPFNWVHKAEFINDYKEMISELKELPSSPKIFISLPFWISAKTGDINNPSLVEMMPMIQQVALDEQVMIMDFYAATKDRPELLYDGIHPDASGAKVLAQTAYNRFMQIFNKGTQVSTNANVTIMASPKMGYEFDHWSDGSNNYSSNPYVYTANSSAVFVAHFREKGYPQLAHSYVAVSQTNRFLNRITYKTPSSTIKEIFNLGTSFVAIPVNTELSGTAMVSVLDPKISVPFQSTTLQLYCYSTHGAIGGRNNELGWCSQALFVDWNGNKNFNEANEQYAPTNIASSDTPSHAFGATSGYLRTMTIPSGQAPGVYKMYLLYGEPTDRSVPTWAIDMINSGVVRSGNVYELEFQIEADAASVAQNPSNTLKLVGQDSQFMLNGESIVRIALFNGVGQQLFDRQGNDLSKSFTVNQKGYYTLRATFVNGDVEVIKFVR